MENDDNSELTEKMKDTAKVIKVILTIVIVIMLYFLTKKIDYNVIRLTIVMIIELAIVGDGIEKPWMRWFLRRITSTY